MRFMLLIIPPPCPTVGQKNDAVIRSSVCSIFDSLMFARRQHVHIAISHAFERGQHCRLSLHSNAVSGGQIALLRDTCKLRGETGRDESPRCVSSIRRWPSSRAPVWWWNPSLRKVMRRLRPRCRTWRWPREHCRGIYTPPCLLRAQTAACSLSGLVAFTALHPSVCLSVGHIRPVFHGLPEPNRAWLLVVYFSR